MLYAGAEIELIFMGYVKQNFTSDLLLGGSKSANGSIILWKVWKNSKLALEQKSF